MNIEFNELENIILEIRWSDPWNKRKGKMRIHLYNFIEMHSITKFRKLLKIIRTSDTPGEEHKIDKVFKKFSEQYESCKQQLAAEKIQHSREIRMYQVDTDVLKIHRNYYTRNGPSSKKYSTLLKEGKEKLTEAKAAYRQAVQREKALQKTMVFIKKCLEIMKQGGV